MSSKPSSKPAARRDGVYAAVSRSGFPFEELVATTCEGAGFDAILSGHSSTKGAADDVECDVLAWKSASVNDFEVSVSLVIECKTIESSSAFVLLSRDGDRGRPTVKLNGRFTGGDGNDLRWGLMQFPETLRTPLLDLEVPWGYHLKQVRKNEMGEGTTSGGKDQAHLAVRQVLASTAGRLDWMNKIDRGAYVPDIPAELAFPTIVVRGKLKRATIGSGRVTSTDEVPMGLLKLGSISSEYSYSLIHVVTWDHFPKFVRGAFLSATTILESAGGAIAAGAEERRQEAGL